jgi:hypothetical protein
MMTEPAIDANPFGRSMHGSGHGRAAPLKLLPDAGVLAESQNRLSQRRGARREKAKNKIVRTGPSNTVYSARFRFSFFGVRWRVPCPGEGRL